MSDPYLYPNSGVLRNKFSSTDQKSLDRREADVVSVRSVLLQRNPVQGNFDAEHLKLIHEYLFRDVYDWAGRLRTVTLAKADYVSGGKITLFTPPELIESELAQVFEGLAAKHFLRGMLRKDFALEIAALLSEINRIHPFREGNGRAQRQFARQLSGSLGFKLHFEVVSKERLVQASILSANGNLAMMERLTNEITGYGAHSALDQSHCASGTACVQLERSLCRNNEFGAKICRYLCGERRSQLFLLRQSKQSSRWESAGSRQSASAGR